MATNRAVHAVEEVEEERKSAREANLCSLLKKLCRRPCRAVETGETVRLRRVEAERVYLRDAMTSTSMARTPGRSVLTRCFASECNDAASISIRFDPNMLCVSRQATAINSAATERCRDAARRAAA
jgi:hypothetical protein